MILTTSAGRASWLTTITLLFLVSNFGFFSASTSNRVLAQESTPTPTPESEELKRLREEKTRAELERDIAAAKKAEFDAKFPKPSTTPLAGETKINEGAVIESEMVSYLSMAYAANRIVEKLRDADKLVIGNLAIYNKTDIDLLLNYRATTAQLEILKQEFCNILTAPKPSVCTDKKGLDSRSPATALGIVGSFLGSFVDMTALLRTNVTIQGHTFDINEASLVSEVFRAARAADGLGHNPGNKYATPNLYYPAAFPPIDPNIVRSELLGRLEQLHDLKAKVLVELNEQEEKLKTITKLKDDIAKLEALIKGGPQEILNAQASLSLLEEIQKEEKARGRALPFEALERMKRLRATIIQLRVDLAAAPAARDAAKAKLAQIQGSLNEEQHKERLAKLKTVNERFDQFVATLIKTDAATGINSLTAYLRAENLKAVMKDDGNNYWLQLAVVKAGGNNRIKTNLIVDIFTGGSRLSHSGGVVVQYNLYDPQGKSVVSDTLTEYTGYTKAGRIKRLVNPLEVKQVPPRTPAHP